MHVHISLSNSIAFVFSFSFSIDLVRPRDTYQFLVEHGELTVFKTLDTPYFSTGKLVIGPHQEKGKQHVGSDILVSLFLHILIFNNYASLTYWT